MGDVFVVEVGSETERHVPKAQVPIDRSGGEIGALGGDAGAERAVGVAQFAVECRLLVDACNKTVEEVGTGVGFETGC